MNHDFIPERFRRAVVLHLARNYLGVSHCPLILGIHGPTGTGKSYQLAVVLKDVDVEMFLISGGQLESGTAGEPARLIRRSYLDAGERVAFGQPAVVVFNDVDTGLGEWSHNTGTVNHQTVLGEMMHLVDSPTSIEGIETRRVPLVMTGNDFGKLYAPLRRPGRMTAFSWTPSQTERAEIVARVFSDWDTATAEELATRFAEAPLSFFSHLRSMAVDGAISQRLATAGEGAYLRSVIKDGGGEPLALPTATELLALAEDVARSFEFPDHLTEP